MDDASRPIEDERNRLYNTLPQKQGKAGITDPKHRGTELLAMCVPLALTPPVWTMPAELDDKWNRIYIVLHT